MHTYAELSGGPGSGVYVTHDGGSELDAHRRATACRSRRSERSMWRSRRRIRIACIALIQDGGSRLDLAVRRWRRELACGELGSALIGRAGYYIRIAVSPADETKSSSRTAASMNRWMAARRSRQCRGAATITISGSIPPIRTAFVMTRRWRHEHHHRSRARIQSRHAADRPDVSRRGGQSGSVLLLRQHAGRRTRCAGRALRSADSDSGGSRKPGGTTAWAAANPASRCPI